MELWKSYTTREHPDNSVLARLDSFVVDQRARPGPSGTEVTLRAWLEGPRAEAWAASMEGIEAALARDLATLAAFLESAP